MSQERAKTAAQRSSQWGGRPAQLSLSLSLRKPWIQLGNIPTKTPRHGAANTSWRQHPQVPKVPEVAPPLQPAQKTPLAHEGATPPLLHPPPSVRPSLCASANFNRLQQLSGADRCCPGGTLADSDGWMVGRADGCPSPNWPLQKQPARHDNNNNNKENRTRRLRSQTGLRDTDIRSHQTRAARRPKKST